MSEKIIYPLEFQKWIRPPAYSERDEITGLTRSTMLNLARKGYIQTRFVKITKTNRRGVRIFWLPSILDYIDSQGERLEHTPMNTKRDIKKAKRTTKKLAKEKKET